MSRKDYSVGAYGSLFILLLIGIGCVIWMGESYALWQARRYVRAHRKGTEPLLLDASMRYRGRLDSYTYVLLPRHAFPYMSWKEGHYTWLLERYGTGLRKSLPHRAVCLVDKTFGVFKTYRVRRCVVLSGKSTEMSRLLRRATIRWGRQACRWRGKACRFGRSWRRVEKQYHFRAGGAPRTCIYAHPLAKRWMSLRFPYVKGGAGIRISFGFADKKKGAIPMRIRIKLHPHKHAKDQKIHMIFKKTIPHAPGWYEHFVPARSLPFQSGALEMRFHTQHHGAKPFCFELVMLRPSTRANVSVHPHGKR